MNADPTTVLAESEPPDATAPPQKWQKVGAKIALTLGLLVAGGIAMAGLIAAGSAAEKGTPPEKVDLVEAMTIERGAARAHVAATGTVVADQQIVLSPEVSGRLVWVSDNLVPGGRFAKGETLARVDTRDYTVAVDQARVAVHQAELELDLERNRGTIAEKEWALLGKDGQSDGRLARREPHLAVAQANLASAQGGLRRAELNLGRTALRAPFNAVVLTENVDVGQVIGASSQVATLSGTDRVRVEVSVPYERVATLSVPGVAGVKGGEGSPAQVRQNLTSGRSLSRNATVVGMGGQLDPQTRTATVLLTVDNPMDPPDGGLPLMVGAFVEVTIDGLLRDDTLRVPRASLYDGDTVWVVSDQGRLESRTVSIGWALGQEVEVRSGLESGDKVVTTPLSAPVAGTRVKLLANAAAAAGEQ